ncbi:MAG: hypothetical protein NHB32_03505 [Fischerella sp. CENA71]|nr:hypothetical protein [Fischerella sp. CENA71]
MLFIVRAKHEDRINLALEVLQCDRSFCSESARCHPARYAIASLQIYS